MLEVYQTKEEYGGFLPLELNPGQELFAKYEERLLRFNSVKASLAYLIERLGCKKIYMPYYYCPSTTEAIKRTGIQVIFYHLDDRLMPADVPDERHSIVLLVDYFGVRSSETERLAAIFKNAEVIIDRAHAFYTEPVIADHIHNVYSAKKFFGIPDGAYVVTNAMMPMAQIPTDACAYAEYLLVTYEDGTNAAYNMKKLADSVIAGKYACMSKLAIGLLKNVDYGRVERQRRMNYAVLHDVFKTINHLELPDNCVAYQYPLLLSGKGRELKRQLVTDKIFVSTLWSGKDLMSYGNTFELDMADNCIFLPIDQRYDESDMRYISKKVGELINENFGHYD